MRFHTRTHTLLTRIILTALILCLLLMAGCNDDDDDDNDSANSVDDVGDDDSHAIIYDPLPEGATPYISADGLPVPTGRYSDETLRQSLDGQWFFVEDPSGTGDAHQWFAPEHDRSQWREITVPGVWNAEFPELFTYNGVGWFALRFDVSGLWPESDYPPEMLLRFGAVFLNSKVYLNGALLGEHRGGYTPFHLPCGRLLKQTGNILVVRADNRITWNTVPVDTLTHLHSHGWWPYGGISRSVTLHDLPDPWLFKLEPSFIHEDSDKLWITLGVRADEAGVVKLSWLLESPVGNEREGALDINVPGPGVHIYRFPIKAETPAVWSRENPENMYRLTLSDPSGGDGLTVRFGYRSFVTDSDEIFLNGKRDYWRGINRHSDYPRQGSVETENSIWREVALIKELNANHVRPGHYPVAERLLDALADAGVTVMEEIPVYQFFLGQVADEGLLENAAHQLGEMIERDKNNPAILAWSIGNEYANYFPGSFTLTKTLGGEARRLDPTRPVATVISNASCVVPLDFCLHNVDIIGVNEYYGWYMGQTPGAGKCLDLIHDMYPNKPIVATEFGAGAVAGRHLDAEPGPEPLGDHSYTEDWQAWFLEQHLNQFLDRDYLSGVMPWVMADFRMVWNPSTGDPHPVYFTNLKGLMTHDRRTKKMSFDLVAGMYEDIEQFGPFSY